MRGVKLSREEGEVGRDRRNVHRIPLFRVEGIKSGTHTLGGSNVLQKSKRCPKSAHKEAGHSKRHAPIGARSPMGVVECCCHKAESPPKAESNGKLYRQSLRMRKRPPHSVGTCAAFSTVSSARSTACCESTLRLATY